MISIIARFVVVLHRMTLMILESLVPQEFDNIVYTDEELAKILQQQEEEMLASAFDLPAQIKPSFNSVIPPIRQQTQSDEEIARKLQEEGSLYLDDFNAIKRKKKYSISRSHHGTLSFI